ncbi:MAG: NAD(P)(+) transhydrogenase (Re/Si-specific) subunit beta [Candidatus Sericytochromatia bacterium]
MNHTLLSPESLSQTREFLYILAALAFVFGIKFLGRQSSARLGNLLSSAGMLVAVIATLFGVGLSFHWVLVGLLIGSAIGIVLALRVPMTGMPEMVALFNGFGGLASVLVALAETLIRPSLTLLSGSATYLSILIGGLTFSGSVIAWGKLSEKISGKPLRFAGQRPLNLLLLLLSLGLGLVYLALPSPPVALLLLGVALALLLGVMGVMPIGGGDMPVVISLLNALSGLAACAVGFVLLNKVLIVTGCLVGASGLILTEIMCKSMNRSLSQVLFGQFGGAVIAARAKGPALKAKSVSAEEAFYLLESAESVMFIPGYGMAVAQAQHTVHELAELLHKRGCEVSYAVHPVAGRMPGHMNVLLAEANVPYEQLLELEEANAKLERVDVCLVIGANDIVNPDARTDPQSPIAGMPILNADQARTVIILKRSMGQGFAGIDNPLFFLSNSRMLFGDARESLQTLIREFKTC